MEDPTARDSGRDRKGWTILPGDNGIPYRTRLKEMPMYKKDDPDHKKPALVNDIESEVLDLSNEDDMNKYREVLNKCSRGIARLVGPIEKHYDDTIKSWRVFITWTNYFYTHPAEASEERINYAKL